MLSQSSSLEARDSVLLGAHDYRNSVLFTFHLEPAAQGHIFEISSSMPPPREPFWRSISLDYCEHLQASQSARVLICGSQTSVHFENWGWDTEEKEDLLRGPNLWGSWPTRAQRSVRAQPRRWKRTIFTTSGARCGKENASSTIYCRKSSGSALVIWGHFWIYLLLFNFTF